MPSVVLLFKWCKDCKRVTKHGRGTAFGMRVEFCEQHQIIPFESDEQFAAYRRMKEKEHV